MQAIECNSLKVFMLDDEDFVRNYVSIIIESLDCQMTGFSHDPNDFLEILPRLQCDLLLMDVCMPGIDGDELLPQIRALRPDLRVAMLTRLYSADVSERCLKLGAVAYILKQGSIVDIAESISKVINQL